MGLSLLLLWPLLPLAPVDGDFRPYVPVDEGVAPAPLFVLLAYAAIWIVLLIFLASIWSRQRRVEGELRALQRRLGA